MEKNQFKIVVQKNNQTKKKVENLVLSQNMNRHGTAAHERGRHSTHFQVDSVFSSFFLTICIFAFRPVLRMNNHTKKL